MNFLEIYETACNKVGVRPNSLLHKTLRDQPVRPITHLQLADNYVGPRGFLALVPLIEKCQTLESLDLRGNGLDNSSIIALCRALRAHLGVHSVDLSRNPISAEGGRHLLELLENNARIVHLAVEQTDLFDAFVDRLQMSAIQNEGDIDNRPFIVPSRLKHGSKDSGGDGSNSAAAAEAGGSHQRRHRLGSTTDQMNSERRYSNVLGSSTNRASDIPVYSTTSSGGGAAGSPGGGSNRRISSGVDRALSVASDDSMARGVSSPSKSASTMRSSHANITGVLRPKPPAPAVASEAYSRLTKEQRDLMKERYKQKAAVFTKVEATASHKLAADFRAELALLEGAQQRTDYSRGGLHVVSPNKKQQTTTTSPSSQPGGDQEEDVGDAEDADSHHQVGRDETSKKELFSPVVDIDDDGGGGGGGDGGGAADGPRKQGEKTTASGSSTAAPSLSTSAREGETSTAATTAGAAAQQSEKQQLQQQQQQQQQADQQQDVDKSRLPSVLVSVPMVPVSAPELTGDAALTPADHFRALFNQGCAYYGEKNYDAAYCSWNEAVHVATQERNREWLTIVQTNLQNLSFEMLTNEATEAIDRGDLNDANRSLDLALKLATKARNASWEADVIKLRRNVLHGSFQANHDGATSLLEKLVNLPAIDVTDDHRFVSPTGQLEAHTAAFVNEWTMLLVVKELMEKCVQSHRCAIGIGGNTGAAFVQLIEGTVTTVSKHLIGKYWAASLHDPMSLAWLGAGRFTRGERDSLEKLWRDLRGAVKELNHPLWSIVELSQYGNLLFASHELVDALDCFEKAAELASSELSDRFLTGTSLFFCAMVNLQRSSFAKAEALFRAALVEFGEVRFGVPALRPPKSSSSSVAAAAGTNADGTDMMLNEPNFIVRDGQQNRISSPQQQSNNNNNNNKSQLNNNFSKQKGGQQLQQQPQGESKSFHVPIEDLCLFHSQAFFMLSRTLIGSYRYREALEAHERFLLYQHHDVLFEKLQSNFSAMPTTDHLRAISASLNHPLVYYAVHYRYDWNLDDLKYDISEHIYSWIVVSEGEGKFNSVDVTNEFKVPSLRYYISAARRGMYVDSSVDTSRGIVTSLNDVAWKTPLRKLYDALMHQVIDVLASYAAYSDLGMFTLIPHGFLWLVPFPALLDDRNRFLLERIALCHALCASQVAFSQLSVRQLLQSNNTRNLVVKPPPSNGGDDDDDDNDANNNDNSGSDGNDDDDDDDDDGNDDDNNNNDAMIDGEGKKKKNKTSNSRKEKRAKRKNANDVVARASAQVLRSGITQEQMMQEVDSLAKSLGSGTVAVPSSSAGDVLAQISYANVAYLCSPIVRDVVPVDRSRIAMKGGIRVASSSFDSAGILSCEDVAFYSLPIETVVLPYGAVDQETVSRDATAESSVSLTRAFIGAGTVSVLFNMWQCSDVYPADFLHYFNCDLQRQGNRAVALARAVRHMIEEEESTKAARLAKGNTNDDTRPLSCFTPRRWASTILVGVSEVVRPTSQSFAPSGFSTGFTAFG